MAINLDNVQTFTDAELLVLYRHALAVGAAGEERQIGDRRIRFPSMPEIRKTIEWLEGRVNADETDGVALAQFIEPQ